MFMPFDRQSTPSRRSHFPPSADATGTPFTVRTSAETNRTAATDSRDFREQADGAP